ncbi:MAG: aspartate carbamoyltransferase catalytic subunit [Actinobacteria bacterium]|jgi:aspartate carbamoyltransferase catalytic subunit|nr:aspartate carbamoyltransferase catalytic subunit [Actinomycetota bacterium]
MNDGRRHLLGMSDVDDTDIERILETAAGFEDVVVRDVKKVPTLRGRTVVNLFYESSTRTSSSFELAAKRLSADVVSVKAAGSSVDKGESLKDTVRTLNAYKPNIIVIRHPQIGAAHLTAKWSDAHVVNAGDGKHQHPTQSLLDLYTIKKRLGRLKDVKVAIVGDVLHSRVARSNIEGFQMMGLDVTLVGPPALIPPGIEEATGVKVSDDPESMSEADVIYVLRMQHERMEPGQNFVPTLREYARTWGVNSRRVKPGQVVMHPGPMNRGVEIAPDVADSGVSLVEDQVEAGLIVRMAVLYDLMNRPSIGTVIDFRERTGEWGAA